MNVLEKIKKIKIYEKIQNISESGAFLTVFFIGMLLFSNAFKYTESNRMERIIDNSTYRIDSLQKDLDYSRDKEHINMVTDYLNDHKEQLVKNEKDLEKNKKQIKNINKTLIYSIVFLLLMIFINLIIFKSNKLNLTKNDHLDLLKMDNNSEKDFIKYMEDMQIENILSDIDYLKEAQSLISKKDWLLKRIKECQNFKNLLSKNEFEEYLSLFEKDFINDYFKE